jgi:hypothetical protein
VVLFIRIAGVLLFATVVNTTIVVVTTEVFVSFFVVIVVGSYRSFCHSYILGCSDFDFFHILRYNHPSLTP